MLKDADLLHVIVNSVMINTTTIIGIVQVATSFDFYYSSGPNHTVVGVLYIFFQVEIYQILVLLRERNHFVITDDHTLLIDAATKDSKVSKLTLMTLKFKIKINVFRMNIGLCHFESE